MQLTRFKVENFRSVEDSGWIDVDRVTALIGVNESGKTNLLLPLWKLNPAREGELVPTSDYPKANYAAIKENPAAFQFITAEFFSKELADVLATKTKAPAEALSYIHVGRKFDGEYTISFPNYKPDNLSGGSVADLIEKDSKEISSLNALTKEGSLKTDIVTVLDAVKKKAKSRDTLQAVDVGTYRDELLSLIPNDPAPTSTLVPRLKQSIEALTELETRLAAPPPSETEGVMDTILNHLPTFVYYSNYGNLDSEIYLPHVVHNMERKDLGAKEAAKARTLRVLFSFVRLQPKEILELGRDFQDPQNPQRQPTADEIATIATKKRERTILLHSAGTDLTKKFGDWWKQGDYTFDFQADGDHFRIWVSDKRRPEKVELEDRSSGLQWFLSFYLIFLVESSGEHRDAILLLDEPGLSLHPLAQRDLSAFFENLANTNQIIYTTHSPFLVDADMLDRARKVFVAENGSTKASSDLRLGSDDPRKSGATYAVWSALNMNVAESLLIGCVPVIVEGPSDQHYLNAIKALLIGAGRIHPGRELVFPPAHGAKNAKVVASILTGRDEVFPTILLDGDDEGKKMATDLRNGLYQTAKDRVLITDPYVGFAASEIEDLFPAEFLSDIVDRWERGPDQPFRDIVKPGHPIVPQIEAWCKSHGISLQLGWKVDLARLAKHRALANPASFSSKVLDGWKKLFEDFKLN